MSWPRILGGLVVAVAIGGGMGLALRDPGPYPWRSADAGPRPPPPRPPNVLIVLWDTVRADRTTVTDPDVPTTPRMAAWAEQHGLVFEQAVSPGMWTVPSHASLFTGTWPATHGASFDHRWLDGKHVTLAEHLRAHGWETYAFSANPNLAPKRVNLLQGFDRIDVSWARPWKRWVVTHTEGKLIPRDRSTEISPSAPGARGVGTYNAAPVTLEAFTRFLDRRTEPERPFFAYLSFMEAHKPRVPTLESREALLEPERLELGLQTDLSFQSQLLYSYGKKSYDAAELSAVRGVYDATLLDLDATTADLMAALEARGLAEDTIVIFTSDHGEQLGEHQQFGHRNGVYQALVHVPLVIAYPRRVAPGRTERPVSTRDVYATVLALAGLPAPEGAQSIEPANLTDPSASETPVYAESIAIDRLGFARVKREHPDVTVDAFAKTYRTVLDAGWKLIEVIDFHTGEVLGHELYDLSADPHETRDLSAAHPDRVAALRVTLDAWHRSRPMWDPETADEVKNAEDAISARELRRSLELLGYVTEEPTEPEPEGQE